MINKVDICGINTSKLPVLNEAQKQELFAKIQTGDTSARHEFIYGNLRLVLSVLQRFSNRNENVDDLFQVGCIGLIKALDNFDTSHGVKFSTYAVPMNVLWGNNKATSPLRCAGGRRYTALFAHVHFGKAENFARALNWCTS